MMRLLRVASCLLVGVAACGPGAALQPLHGEDPEVWEAAGIDGSLLELDAPVLAARRVRDLVRARRFDAVWEAITPRMRRALAAAVGTGGGDRRPPPDASAAGPQVWLRVLFGTVPAHVDPVSDAGAVPPQASESPVALVRVRDARGASVVSVRLVFDGRRWRLDGPAAAAGTPSS